MATKKEVLDAALRGEGCLGRSADDEPVFVLCARDLVSSDTVRYWAREAYRRGSPTAKVQAASNDAVTMDEWRTAHGGGKVPD